MGGVVDKKKRITWCSVLVGFLVGGACFGLVWMAYLCPEKQWWRGYWLLHPVCHQEPERCFQVNGLPWALCVRCVSIWLALGIGHVVFVFWRPSFTWMRRGLFVSIGAMFLDVGLEWLGFYHNVAELRMLTGFLFGIFTAYFTLLGLLEISSMLTSRSYSRHD